MYKYQNRKHASEYLRKLKLLRFEICLYYLIVNYCTLFYKQNNVLKGNEFEQLWNFNKPIHRISSHLIKTKLK